MSYTLKNNSLLCFPNVVIDLVRLQVFPNIREGNLIGLDAGVHEIADNVVLSDLVRAGELDALKSREFEAGLHEEVDKALQEARSIVFSRKLGVQAIIGLLFVGLRGGCDKLEKKADEGNSTLDSPATIINAGTLVETKDDVCLALERNSDAVLYMFLAWMRSCPVSFLMSSALSLSSGSPSDDMYIIFPLCFARAELRQDPETDRCANRPASGL